MHRFQSGNTFMGILLGIIIALLCAIGAALTWGAAPLSSIVKPAPSSPAAVNVTKIDAVPVLPAVPAGVLTPATVPVTGAAESDKPLQSAAEMAEEILATPPSDDQAGEIPKEKPISEVEVIAPPSYEYTIQAGSFAEKLQAEAVTAQLALTGLDAKIVEKSTSTSTLFKVVLGPYSEKTVVQEVLQKLSENDIDAMTTRSVKLVSKPKSE